MKNKERIDVLKLNEVLALSSNILKITFVFFCVIGIYAITLILKEWKIFHFLFTILRILLPLFIGIIIAWLLEPGVKYLQKKGLNRLLGAAFLYIAMLSLIYFGLTMIFPMILDQINDFLVILPSILDSISIGANRFLENFKNITIIDVEMIKTSIVDYINGIINSLTTEIPTLTINFVSSLFSTIGIFALGLIIGFYLLVGFDNVGKTILSLLPVRARSDARSLLLEANSSLFSYLKGILIISLVVFITSTTVFTILGVKAPILLGLICGVTNIIPFIGPYMGGSIAGVVALTQSIPLGIITIILIIIIQTLESIILQPLVMGKTMKLHPVIVLIGLLIFGYFFGIIGMIIATPLVALIKVIIIYVKKKYGIFTFAKKIV